MFRLGRNRILRVCVALGLSVVLTGCQAIVAGTDRQVYRVIAERQQEALQDQPPVVVPVDEDLFTAAPRQVYDYVPQPRRRDVPEGFAPPPPGSISAEMQAEVSPLTSEDTETLPPDAGIPPEELLPPPKEELPPPPGEPLPPPDERLVPDEPSPPPGRHVPPAAPVAPAPEGELLPPGESIEAPPPATAPAVEDEREVGPPTPQTQLTEDELDLVQPPAPDDLLREEVPAVPPEEQFTLIAALVYAQQHRRALATAQEELYVVALALTLERHLWTPIFASNLRTVYGNFGEITDFDQAMRFVADLGVTQRLPYGGEFTAQAVSTLIRDVKKSITAEEGSTIELGLRIPFLRNAGHVAREELIQLERELTYAVRAYERFRREQIVDVAQSYFALLLAKQNLIDQAQSLRRVAYDYERALEFEQAGFGSPLDTQRAAQQMLSSQNALEDGLENFRAQADRFKIQIGMPVDQPLPRELLEDIESIEAKIDQGLYPVLLRPPAVEDEAAALEVAREFRLDLLNTEDRIGDARRGVAVAKNQLLPDLDLLSTVTWYTDPTRYKLGDFSFERTTWRSELVLGLPLERFREKTQYRAALIDVRQAQRTYEERLETIRADVRSAVNQIRLQERSIEIQERNLMVAERRLEFARIQYEEGEIGNRDLFEAEDEWQIARARLNRAKTDGWSALLEFRLATGTLRVPERVAIEAGEPAPPVGP